jgi:nitrogen regulatory protein PII
VENVKRLEIITDALAMKEVCATLDKQGIPGWTIIRDVIGHGERGEQTGDELTDVFKNSYLLTTCEPHDAQRIVEAVRPILKKRGGVCLVSDAQWVIH